MTIFLDYSYSEEFEFGRCYDRSWVNVKGWMHKARGKVTVSVYCQLMNQKREWSST